MRDPIFISVTYLEQRRGAERLYALAVRRGVATIGDIRTIRSHTKYAGVGGIWPELDITRQPRSRTSAARRGDPNRTWLRRHALGEQRHGNEEKATRGKYAALVSGANAIEIKVTIPETQVDSTLARFGLTIDNDEERYIYFFDTPELELHRSGIITRARRVVGDQHDSTVKFRPVTPEQVGNRWRDLSGLQDRGGRPAREGRDALCVVQHACRKQALIKQIACVEKVDRRVVHRGTTDFSAQHGEPQDRFFTDGSVRSAARASREIRRPGLARGRSLTGALVTLRDGARMMEASIKAPVVQGRGRARRLHGVPRGIRCRAGRRGTGQDTVCALDFSLHKAATRREPRAGDQIGEATVDGSRKATKTERGIEEGRSPRKGR